MIIAFRSFMFEIEFPFRMEQRERFRSEKLIDEWANKYPDIFDEHDIRLAKSQPKYHFYEWLGAVLFFNSTGYFSLIEKYETKFHKRKVDIFKQIAPKDIYELILDTRTGAPDLFVYSPKGDDWFFCEIKGHNDKLRMHQLDLINKIELLSHINVKILNLKLLKDEL